MQSDGEGKGVEFQSEPFAFKRCTSRQGQTERGVRELWCGSGESVSGGGGEKRRGYGEQKTQGWLRIGAGGEGRRAETYDVHQLGVSLSGRSIGGGWDG